MKLSDYPLPVCKLVFLQGVRHWNSGSTSLEEDGKEEQPRHIISKTAEEISCIRTAMKGDGVLRKLSEAQLNALINEFDELKVRVSTSKLFENW